MAKEHTTDLFHLFASSGICPAEYALLQICGYSCAPSEISELSTRTDQIHSPYTRFSAQVISVQRSNTQSIVVIDI